MVNRVELSSNGLKVSKPGYDVLTAALENLSLDSSTQLAGVYSTGIAGPWTRPTAVTTQTFTIPFGVTFSSIPIVIAQQVNTANSRSEFGWAIPWDTNNWGGPVAPYMLSCDKSNLYITIARAGTPYGTTQNALRYAILYTRE